MVAIPAGAEDGLDKPGYLEEVTIVGTRDDVQRVAGSAHFIGAEEIERFSHTDVQRIVRQVPGVSIQVEDGFGLRPNISIRGVATERSGRITLLEDGVLIAPAPYSAPSAYYFPTVGRMAAFEILKGPAAITQGPYTIGGAFNMISTPIPAEGRGRVFAEAGQHATNRLHATYGGTADNGFGFLVESHQWRSDGYQSVDRSDRDTGLDVRDTTVKLAYEPNPGQAFELKLQRAAQESNQSYLGLTDADFHANAIRRYGVSALDHIATDHEQVIARYEYAPTAQLKFTAAAYHNGHARNWFKTEGLDVDGSANAQDFRAYQLGKRRASCQSGQRHRYLVGGTTPSGLERHAGYASRQHPNPCQRPSVCFPRRPRRAVLGDLDRRSEPCHQSRRPLPRG